MVRTRETIVKPLRITIFVIVMGLSTAIALAQPTVLKVWPHGGSRERLLGSDPDKQTLNHFSNELQVTGRTPMAFLVHSADDRSVPVQNSISYALALKQNAVPVELHIFEQGGHGYGLATTRKSTESRWPALCLEWLRMHGML